MVKSSTPLIVNGATGRMGARICELASADPAFELVAALTHAGSRAAKEVSRAAGVPLKTPENIGDSAVFAKVVIDFSCDAGTREALAVARAHRLALLVGTTALTTDTLAAIRDATAHIPVLVAPNTSTGVAALCAAVRTVVAALGSGFGAAIVETHHTRKKDAPSGTALHLAGQIRRVGASVSQSNIVSVRSGEVVGEHIVRFDGPGETIELVHRATSRDVFAHGALRAAAWLAGKPAGSYTMEDVLALPR